MVRTRAKVLATAEELLLDGGPAAVTVEAVAARSGIAKTTIYRHWPTHEALVIELLLTLLPEVAPPPAHLSARQALRELCRTASATMADHRWERLLPAMLLVKLRYGKVADVEARMHQNMAAVVTGTLQRLVDRGELQPSAATQYGVHLLLGPLVMARLMGSCAITPAFADDVAEQFHRAHRA